MKIKVLIIYLTLCTMIVAEFLELKKYRSYHPNGKVFIEGSHVGDKKIGYWYKYDENGVVREEYSFVSGKPIVGVTVYSEEGIVSGSGFLSRGFQEGWWSYYDSSGEKLVKIEYKKGIKDGKFIAYSEFNAPIVVGIFEKDKIINVEILK